MDWTPLIPDPTPQEVLACPDALGRELIRVSTSPPQFMNVLEPAQHTYSICVNQLASQAPMLSHHK